MRGVMVAGPGAEPVSLQDYKDHARTIADQEDTLLTAYLKAARRRIEEATGLRYVVQVWDWYLDAFPDLRTIIPPYFPLREVVSITYTDTQGDSQTLSTSKYVVDTTGDMGRISLAYGETWPSTYDEVNVVKIRMALGFATAFTAATDTDLITAANHPYSDGDVIRLQNSQNASGGALPAPLAVDTDYYVRDVSGDGLKLATSSGGSAIDITDTGTGTHFLGEVPETSRVAIMEFAKMLAEIREPVVLGTIKTPIPETIDALLWSDRVVGW